MTDKTRNEMIVRRAVNIMKANLTNYVPSGHTLAMLDKFCLSIVTDNEQILRVFYFILFYFALYCIVLYCIVLYCIVLYCIVLYCIVLYCIVLYCIVLYCIVLYYSIS